VNGIEMFNKTKNVTLQHLYRYPRKMTGKGNM